MKKETAATRRKRLLYKPVSVFDALGEHDEESIETISEAYRDLLDSGKTVRECVENARAMAEQWGFKPFERGVKLNPGDKVYTADNCKNIVLAVIGSAPLSDGARIMAAHVDTPGLDLKPNPLYEDSGLAMLKTHYYGGIKKYQWLAMPLELRGVVFLKNGGHVDIHVGADPYDPVLTITDLLPHLSAEQNKKTISEGFSAENLNVLIGLRPYADVAAGDEDRVKLAVMSWLNEKYGIVEEDLRTAELSLVPASNARDVGFDRAMLGAYGQDDRVCAFAGLHAILRAENPVHTAVCVLADKEEIGSEGISGIQSGHFDAFMEELCDMQQVKLRHCYAKSFCFSGDVCNAYDPNFADAHDKRNNARLGYGVSVVKYTGSRGKSGASDASAETFSRTRGLLEGAGVVWQTGELGRVDLGGGGTMACFIARRNIEVIDVGISLLSMHAPFEVVAKADLFMLCKAFSALFAD
ncbi:MAG: aminopeptidase [Oscillospiraceae bacterium]|nr:aminopeptidase [Oscillospiraceae bacterium]